MHFHCVLINNSYLENLSVRYLSAHLKSRGYRVGTIHYEGRKNDVFNLLTRQSLEALAACCREASLVGISLLTTHQLSRSRQIQDFLAGRIKAPIIWGGVPVICDPEFYLQYTDYVCLGEGESVLEDLLEGRDPAAVKGLGFRAEDGSLHCNPLPDLCDVNTGPIPVLDLEDGFFLQDSGELLPVSEGMGPVHRSYSILSVRGCPYHCSYCLNSCLKNIFAGTGASIRYVSTPRVIEELEQAKNDLPDLRRVIFDDDDFFLRSESDLQELCETYTQKINLPIFYIQAHMHTITEKKVDILLHSGIRLQYLKIGLQSASVRVNQAVFERRFEKNRFLGGLRMLSAKGVRVMLDVISANPYETAEDSYASLVFYDELVRQTRKLATTAYPMKIYDHKLMFYPGSKLYAQAQHDGLIADDYVEKVLLQRNTLRKLEEDIDHEAFVVALVNRALRSRSSWHPAALLLRLLRVKPLYTLVYRWRLVNRIYHRTGLNLTGLFTKGCGATVRPADHQSGLEFVYSPPADLVEGRFEAICRLVEAGGSVGSDWIRSNLQRAYLIGYVLDQDALIACSSLKEPRPEYIASVKQQTGLDLSRYLERGYTSVRPAYRGQGIASRLLAGLTARAGERKLYSIIGEDNIGGQKIALNNKTRRVAVFRSQKSGKKLGVWIPEVMLEP